MELMFAISPSVPQVRRAICDTVAWRQIRNAPHSVSDVRELSGGRRVELHTGNHQMSQWSEQVKEIRAITLFVDDIGVAKQFYQDVFGLPVYFEDENSAVFRFGGVLINLLDVAAAGTLIEPAAAGTSAAESRSQYTIGVSDVDAVCAELAQRGVTLLNGPMNRPWGIRTAAFTDPSGHIWEIAQDLS